MADILIKGMEMPKDGAFYVVLRPKGAYCYGRVKEGYTYHQVVEVKPHGRLIDATELEAGQAIDLGKETWDMVHNAPTVLEATE